MEVMRIFEIHYVRLLRILKKNDFLCDLMFKMNPKQVPLCKSYYFDVYSSFYDKKLFRSVE